METVQEQRRPGSSDVGLEEQICCELRRLKFYRSVVSSEFLRDEKDQRVEVAKRRIRIMTLVLSSLHEAERFVVWQRLVEGRLWEQILFDADTGSTIVACSQSSLYRHLQSALQKMTSLMRSQPGVFSTVFCDSLTEHGTAMRGGDSDGHWSIRVQSSTT